MIRGSALRSDAAKPVCETGGAEQRVLTFWDQAALLERRAEIASLLVGDDRAGIVMRREVLADDLIKRNGLWSATAILAKAATTSSERIG